ncbi:MAG: TolC family protein [Elusimicrobiota bacterium]|jgi:TolC family type I secretion outer membrane protein|nr:TolC family protein [Elusimicrobiota bacterium]
MKRKNKYIKFLIFCALALNFGIIATAQTTGQDDLQVQRANPKIIDQGAQLTLDECIELTLHNNPKIAAALYSTEAQRSRLSQTKANYLPQVNANASYTRSDREAEQGFVGAGDSYSSSISATQLLYDFGKTSLTSSVQENAYFASQEDAQNIINNTIYSLKQAYYNVLYAKESRDVFTQSVEQYEEQLKRAKAFYDVGTRPKIDVTTAQVNLNNAKLNLIQAENALKTTSYTLLNVMGIYDSAPSFTLKTQNTIPDYQITQEEALKTAMDTRPDLASYRLKVDSARQNVKLSQTGFAPELNANGSYGWGGEDFPLYDRWSVGAGISVPIFSGLSTVNKVKESKSNLKTAHANLTDAEQSVLLDVKKAYFSFEDAKSRVPVARLSRQQAKENYDLAVGRYKVGVGNYIEVKDAEITYSNSKLAYIKAVFDYNLAIADLNRAMGIKNYGN